MSLYPEIEPYNSDFLNVSDNHTLFYEESGNPNGIPVIFLHGGPGGGIEPLYRQFFNPEKYRIILFDQRGCGKSTPNAELKDNTTWHLIDDIEKIRLKLGVPQWLVFGGSWGSTLALSYAIKHPIKCLGLILRGVFLVRKKEIEWFYQNGAGKIYPEFWQDFIKPIPEKERHDLLTAYYRRLTGENKKIKTECARAWALWEARTSKLLINNHFLHNVEEDDFSLAFARIESHYFINNGFFESENWLLENASSINHLKCVIIHGRYDMVCPVENAWELHHAIKGSTLDIIPDAGHSMIEPGIQKALIEATDNFK